MRKKIHIAVLDSLAENVKRMETVILKAGIPAEVIWIRNKSAFTAALRESAPDVILAGSSAHGLNVAEVLRTSRSLRAGVPVIAVSSAGKGGRTLSRLPVGKSELFATARVSALGGAVKEALRRKEILVVKKGSGKEILLLAQALASSKDIISITDAANRFIYVNQSFLDFYGYSRKEVLGKKPRLLIAANNSVVKERGIYEKALIGGLSVELLNRKKDGTLVPITLSTSTILDDEGSIAGIVGVAQDISERRKVELALKDSEARYRKVVENASDLIFTTDANGTFVYANPAAVKAAGYSLDELRRLHYLDLVMPEFRAKVEINYLRQFLKRIPMTYTEYPFHTKSGVERWFGQSASLIMEGDTPAGFHVIARDITERKRAEDELLVSEKKFKDIFNLAPVGICQFSEKGILLIANQTLADILGYGSAQELSGLDIRDALSYDGGSTVSLESALEGGEPVDGLKTIWRRKNGSPVWIELDSHAVRDESGSLLHFEAYVRDITVAKQAQEALNESNTFNRLLVHAIPFGIDIVDEEGEILFMSERMKSIVGRAGIGDRCWDVYKDDKVQCRNCPLRSGAASETPSMVQVDGVLGEKSFEIYHVGIEYLGKRAMLEVFQDVSDRKKSEEAVRQAQKMESLGVLAGGIAHDFNNLLAAMLGHTSLALKRLDHDHPALINVVRAERAAERASDITRQLLAYSGRGKFDVKPLNMSKLVQDNIHLLHVLVQKSVKIVQELQPDLSLIDADAGQIQQVVMNLVINAAESIGAKPGTILCRTWSEELSSESVRKWTMFGAAKLPGKFVILEIADDGCGIPAEAISKIFDPFFTTKFTGRGLGLPAVLGIVQGHHGGLRIVSDIGKGTKIRIAFPASESLVEMSTPPLPVVGQKLIEGSILVIDDEEPVREVVAEILKEHKISSLLASDGETGIELYKQRQSEISLILLDLSMPGIGGVETCRRLKEINSEVRIILSSGYAEEEASREFTSLDIVGFIHKPYRWDQFMENLSKYSYEESSRSNSR